MKTYRLLLTILMICVTVSVVLADDLFTPTYRGQPLSTVAEWEFLTPGNFNPAVPDGTIGLVVGDGITPSGLGPNATFQSPSVQWDPAYDGDGAWVFNAQGFIELEVPNWIDQEPLKQLRLQITYIGNVAPTIFDIFASDAAGTAHVTNPVTPPIITTIDQSNGVRHVYEDWEIRPNPDFEIIRILVPVDTAIDQIVLDTVSVPEPTSLVLLGLGGVTLLRKRKKT